MLNKIAAIFQHNGHRLPILYCGEPSWAVAKVQAQLQSLTTKSILKIGPNIDGIKTTQFHHYLGHEFDIVWFHGFDGYHPDAIAALSGTVKAGGLFIVTMPADTNWTYFPDPDIKRFCQWSASNTINTTSPFLAYQWQQWQHSAIIIKQNLSNALADDKMIIPANFYQHLQRPAFTRPHQATTEQAAIVESVLDNSSQYHVITAHRGRGKSTTLGILAAKLANKGIKTIISAPRADSCKQVSHWYQENSKIDINQSLTFMAPDQIIKKTPSAEILLIDEAAAIPPDLLKKLCHVYPNIVFATTEHGYEGCGRGFSIRFLNWLKQEHSVIKHTLTQPIRWAENDPLEYLINHLMLLDAEPTSLPQTLNTNEIDINWYSPEQLLAEPVILSQAFGLLIQAHYRTSPSDLRYILDATTFKIAITTIDKHVVGVLLVSEEGGLPEELALTILQGRRRPNGHLFPQTIAAQVGLPMFAQLNGYRITRIAVLPELQNKSIGRQMLAWLQTQAKQAKLDYLASSFGATANLLHFWQQNNYQLVRMGLTPETSTGELSAAVLLSLTSEAALFEPTLLMNAQQEIIAQKKRYLHFSPELQQLIQKNNSQPLSDSKTTTALLKHDKVILDGFANHHTNFNCARASIEKALKYINCEEGILYAAAVLILDEKSLIETYRLTGKKQLLQRLRHDLGKILPLLNF